jgi:hypothetical protein
MRRRRAVIVVPVAKERINTPMSFAPFGMYAMLDMKGIDVHFEFVRYEDDVEERVWSKMIDYDELYVSITNPDQEWIIEFCQKEIAAHNKMLEKFITPHWCEPQFFGLKDYIPDDCLTASDDWIQGMFRIHLYYQTFKRYRAYNGELDHHFCTVSNRTVVPVFTSWGCKNRCPFCYNSSEKRYEYVECSLDDLETMAHMMDHENISFHFMDEDLCKHSKLKLILEMCKDSQSICLSSIEAYLHLHYSRQEQFNKAFFCIEVGVEDLDEKISGKKQNVQGFASQIMEDGPYPYFLTQTFLPGQTVGSLYRLGKALRDSIGASYMGMIQPRGRCNGHANCIGQMFNPIKGTTYWKKIEAKEPGYEGRWLERPGTRMSPSWVPQSFIDSVKKSRFVMSNYLAFKRDLFAGLWAWHRISANDAEFIIERIQLSAWDFMSLEPCLSHLLKKEAVVAAMLARFGALQEALK